ncbi:unnamed protein product [Dovyalis caffra]|uniref:Uncharacterized protein n=1 Tax=Dovyalis caffra TaxID=77055 RepID=A0AAV1SIJ7_9ROSI|nr:unnamed protein product [Dovyalis caffra]
MGKEYCCSHAKVREKMLESKGRKNGGREENGGLWRVGMIVLIRGDENGGGKAGDEMEACGGYDSWPKWRLGMEEVLVEIEA